MILINELSKLSPSGRVRLVTVDASEFGGGIHRFHYHAIPYTEAEINLAYNGDGTYDDDKLKPKGITFDGQLYDFWPYAIEDMELSSEQAARPKLSLSNVGSYISALCLQFEDLLKARVTITTLTANFLDDGPDADPDQCQNEEFFIDLKSYEDDEMIQFELSNPADLNGAMVPRRQLLTICTWAMDGLYRSGDGCTYNGNRYFDERGNPVSDPALDRCGGCLSDCKLRFGENNALDFGGFPAAQLIQQ
ncbi:minor tail protein [Pantoea phage vB_PagS_MED16]|nr:minor tail protein [Pantoea phage vB_PagS_MED16]